MDEEVRGEFGSWLLTLVAMWLMLLCYKRAPDGHESLKVGRHLIGWWGWR